MKINKQPYLIWKIFFSVIIICLVFLYLLNYVSGVTIAISVGVNQLFLGFYQINMAQVKDSNGINKGNKKVGVFCVFAGVFIIINVIIKVMI